MLMARVEYNQVSGQRNLHMCRFERFKYFALNQFNTNCCLITKNKANFRHNNRKWIKLIAPKQLTVQYDTSYFRAVNCQWQKSDIVLQQKTSTLFTALFVQFSYNKNLKLYSGSQWHGIWHSKTRDVLKSMASWWMFVSNTIWKLS